jgi:hypothetical protein
MALPYGGANGGSSDVKEFLDEAADLLVPVNKVDLEDPVTLQAGTVAAAHAHGVARGDIGADVVAGDLLVRELAD